MIVVDEDLGLLKLKVPKTFLLEADKPDFDRFTFIPPTLHLPLTTLEKFCAPRVNPLKVFETLQESLRLSKPLQDS